MTKNKGAVWEDLHFFRLGAEQRREGTGHRTGGRGRAKGRAKGRAEGREACGVRGRGPSMKSFERRAPPTPPDTDTTRENNYP